MLIKSILFKRKCSVLSSLISLIILVFILASCTMSKNTYLPVVQSLDVERYMGTWYEIARLPNSFEEGLICVTATYSLLDNGKIRVINKGRNQENPEEIETAKGKAKFADKSTPGKLKVTFFWPFYGKYWIIELDEDYKYALVGSPSREYLWILSRTKQLPESTVKKLTERAEELGFETKNLYYTAQTCNN